MKFIVLGMILVVLGLVSVVQSEKPDCDCENECFNDIRANADYHIRVRIKEEQASAYEDTRCFRCVLKKTFKSSGDFNETVIYVSKDCPVTLTPNGEALYIAGKFAYYCALPNLYVNDCDVVAPWNDFGKNNGEKKKLKKCKDFDFCNPNPCDNGGTCQPADNDDCYTCDCPEGFSGEHCEECGTGGK